MTLISRLGAQQQQQQQQQQKQQQQQQQQKQQQIVLAILAVVQFKRVLTYYFHLLRIDYGQVSFLTGSLSHCPSRLS